MNESFDFELLTEMLDGRLSETQRRAVEEHLASHADDAEVYREMVLARRKLHGLPPVKPRRDIACAVLDELSRDLVEPQLRRMAVNGWIKTIAAQPVLSDTTLRVIIGVLSMAAMILIACFVWTPRQTGRTGRTLLADQSQGPTTAKSRNDVAGNAQLSPAESAGGSAAPNGDSMKSTAGDDAPQGLRDEQPPLPSLVDSPLPSVPSNAGSNQRSATGRSEITALDFDSDKEAFQSKSAEGQHGQVHQESHPQMDPSVGTGTSASIAKSSKPSTAGGELATEPGSAQPGDPGKTANAILSDDETQHAASGAMDVDTSGYDYVILVQMPGTDSPDRWIATVFDSVNIDVDSATESLEDRIKQREQNWHEGIEKGASQSPEAKTRSIGRLNSDGYCVDADADVLLKIIGRMRGALLQGYPHSPVTSKNKDLAKNKPVSPQGVPEAFTAGPTARRVAPPSASSSIEIPNDDVDSESDPAHTGSPPTQAKKIAEFLNTVAEPHRPMHVLFIFQFDSPQSTPNLASPAPSDR